MNEWLIGIDEAGRGPVAGPVAVGVVLVPADFDWGLLPGVNDSKQLSEKKREEIFEAARQLKAAGQLCYAVAQVSASVIDKIGIVSAVNLGIKRGLARAERDLKSNVSINVNINTNITFDPSLNVKVLLDGGLKAPEQFVDQETIIKGDAKEPVIGLASIIAKVTRDHYMTRVSREPAYTKYHFDIHKGYGTKAHREAIAKFDLSPQHRVGYCKNIKRL